MLQTGISRFLRVACLPTFLALLIPVSASAQPRATETTVIGPLTGAQASLHPDNLAPHPVAYMGTDLGWTYEHQGQLQIIFGDTAADNAENPIEASTGATYDDAFGSIDL